MRFQFIADHQTEFPITRMCRVLGVSRSGYYAWRKRPPSRRKMADEQLSDRIKEIYDESDGTYGSPRIQAELADLGMPCGQKRVARLTRTCGSAGVREENLRASPEQRFKVVTTDTDHAYPIAPNLLQQRFVTCAGTQCR